MPFRPTINFQLIIGQNSYRFTEHPAAKGMPYGQSGKRATVYQVIDESNNKFAFKVFNAAFRLPSLAANTASLQSYANTPGLSVCNREIITRSEHPELISTYPDLEFAVLMPWVQGETWQEYLVSNRALKPDSARALAGQMCTLLGGLEQRGLAHCDIAGPNLMVDFGLVGNKTPSEISALSLVDVEEMYGPGLTRPERLPAGTDGYNHKVAQQGLWSADADRFAGAVVITEMLTRHDDRIRNVSLPEQYFDRSEMQTNCDRYQLAVRVLKEQGDSLVADLFSKTWFSQSLSECPTFSDWTIALNRQASSFQTNNWTAKPSIASTEIKSLLKQAFEEGRWQDALNIANQLLQNNTADPEVLVLQSRAQRLVLLDQTIQQTFQLASHSGFAEDWEHCLRMISSAQYQAKNLQKYEELRQHAEHEHTIALQANTLKQLIETKQWDEALALRDQLPLEHHLIAEIYAQLDIELAKQKRTALVTRNAQTAAEQFRWEDAIRLCREGLLLEPENPTLKEILVLAQREQTLNQQVSEHLQNAQQALQQQNWQDAETSLRKAIELQPGRNILSEQLNEVLLKRQWFEKIQSVSENLTHTDPEELIGQLADIPAGFGAVDDVRNQLDAIQIWRANLQAAQQAYDIDTVEQMLRSPMFESDQVQNWLQQEKQVVEQLNSARATYDAVLLASIVQNLPDSHPLKHQAGEWLDQFEQIRAEIAEARQNFEPELVLTLISRLPDQFPGISETRAWAEEAIQSHQSLLEARSKRDIHGVEVTLAHLPQNHPARRGAEAWLKEEKSRKEKLKQLRDVGDVAAVASLLAHIPEDDDIYADDWQWLNQQKNQNQQIDDCMAIGDIESLASLLRQLPSNHPRYNEIQAFCQQETALLQQINAAKQVYDFEQAGMLLAKLPPTRQLVPELQNWVETHRQLKKDIETARASWNASEVLALLSKVTELYPDYTALSQWAATYIQHHQLASQLISNASADELETLLLDFSPEAPGVTEIRQKLQELRAEETELGRLLTQAEQALAQKDWSLATQTCAAAKKFERASERFAEIAKEAEEQLNAQKVFNSQLEKIDKNIKNKKYAEALKISDEVSRMAPAEPDIAHTGLNIRQQLIQIARDFEAKNKWGDSTKVWSALKSAGPAPEMAGMSPIKPKTSTVFAETLFPARELMKNGKFEEAAYAIQNADASPNQQDIAWLELFDAIRLQARNAQSAGRWDKARELWQLLKKIKEENGK